MMPSIAHPRWPTARSVGVPCYGCGKLATCTICPDLSACKCWRDGGAIHRSSLRGNPPLHLRRRTICEAEIPKLSEQWVTILTDKFRKRVNEADLAELSRRLGVSESSLRRLGIGWDGSAWTFPMFDGSVRPIGLHRRFPGGRKICLRGSHLGLFIPFATQTGNGNESPQEAGNRAFVTSAPPLGGLVLPPPIIPLLICEGASDTAAALTLGYSGVGVPSAGQGADLLVEFIQRVGPRSVVIVADLDEGTSGAKGKITCPGIEGGLALAAQIMTFHSCIRFCLPPPGVKDLRQWMSRDDWDSIRRTIAGSPQVNSQWLNQAHQNVLEHRSQAAAFLIDIPDAEMLADLRERFDERAGIIEYEGNLPRDEAERHAHKICPGSQGRVKRTSLASSFDRRKAVRSCNVFTNNGAAMDRDLAEIVKQEKPSRFLL